ncbi:MAG: hypothetical protein HYS34_05390, partial [Acidobacteria bacterium]|nr:hypothetical protein [Acidobacteriota bacterium]
RCAGEAAARARAARLPPARLPLGALREITPLVEEAVFAWLDVRASLARRGCEGGTAPARVAEALRRVRAWTRERAAGQEARVEPDARS